MGIAIVLLLGMIGFAVMSRPFKIVALLGVVGFGLAALEARWHVGIVPRGLYQLVREWFQGDSGLRHWFALYGSFTGLMGLGVLLGVVRKASSTASALSTAISNGLGSSLNRACPADTISPSRNRTAITCPPTRGRISTRSAASTLAKCVDSGAALRSTTRATWTLTTAASCGPLLAWADATVGLHADNSAATAAAAIPIRPPGPVYQKIVNETC